MYYSIVILAILYYLRVADLIGITSPYPRENIIAGNYILADMQAYLDKRHRQQNKEILIRHSPGIGECFLLSNIQLTEKIKKISLHILTNENNRAIIQRMPHKEVEAAGFMPAHHIWRVNFTGGATDVRNYCNRW